MNKSLFIFILSLFLLASCTLFQKQTEVSDILGTDGVVIIIPSVPKELSSGQGIEIPITLQNVGAHKVQNAVLTITGYNPEYVNFRTTPKVEGINLEGKTRYIPGEKITKFFTISSITVPESTVRTEVFDVFVCYQYQTIATAVVCINPQLAFGETAVISGCDFADAKISASQGAPVAVTKVQTWYYSDKNEVEFRIFVKDVSNKGVVIENSAYSRFCLSSSPVKELDLVDIKAYIGGQEINCYIGNEQVSRFKIIEEGYSVVCRTPYDMYEQAFTTPLSLMLSYGYVTREGFSIDLKNTAVKRE